VNRSQNLLDCEAQGRRTIVEFACTTVRRGEGSMEKHSAGRRFRRDAGSATAREQLSSWGWWFTTGRRLNLPRVDAQQAHGSSVTPWFPM